MVFMQEKDQTDVHIASMQNYNMASQYDNVNLGDYDVVRSTQFVDDLTRGVHVFGIFVFIVFQPLGLGFPA